MDDVYKKIEEYNAKKKCKIFIVFNDISGDMLSNKKHNPTIVTELFIRGRKLNISLAFITFFISYFAIPKHTRLNSTHYFIMKVPKNDSFNKLHLIIHQILTLETLWIFTKNVLQNHIHFYWLMLLLHKITFYVSERIF